MGRDSFFFLTESFPYDETSFGELPDKLTTKKAMLASRPISYVFDLRPPSNVQFGNFRATLRQCLHDIERSNQEISLVRPHSHCWVRKFIFVYSHLLHSTYIKKCHLNYRRPSEVNGLFHIELCLLGKSIESRMLMISMAMWIVLEIGIGERKVLLYAANVYIFYRKGR